MLKLIDTFPPGQECLNYLCMDTTICVVCDMLLEVIEFYNGVVSNNCIIFFFTLLFNSVGATEVFCD